MSASTRFQQVFKWLVVALLGYALGGAVLLVVRQAMRVDRYSSANLVPYLVNFTTIPKYLLIAALLLALWFFLSNRRIAAYSLFLVGVVMVFVVGIFSLGRGYQEAQYASQLEFDLIGLAQLSIYVLLVLLGPIGIFGLMNQISARSARPQRFGG